MRLRDIQDWPPQWQGISSTKLSGEDGILLDAQEGLYDGQLLLEVKHDNQVYTGVVTPGTIKAVQQWCEILDNFRDHRLQELAGTDL